MTIARQPGRGRPSSRLHFDPVEIARDHWHRLGWKRAAAGMAAVTSVMRAEQIFLSRANDILRPHGLTFARYEVLTLLSFSRRGSLPLGKLGERLQVAPATVTNAVNRLESDGLLRRVRHPTDGRTTLAEISSSGSEVVVVSTDALNQALFEDMGLTDAELAQLFALLRRVRLAAGDFEPHAW